ncbi:MAG: DUF2441 domain-containing protein [Nitrospirae bacterium]|nr:MAG: DUF2441 domain-containing protein [Nitrospirota bacterium]
MRGHRVTQADTTVDYYHINRRAAWAPYQFLQAGSILDVGGTTNPYFAFFENHKKTYPVTQRDGSTINVSGVRFLGAVANDEVNSTALPGIAHDLAKHLVAFLRELIWEDVRRKEFPHLPSRQRCIWLIPSLAGVRYWLKRMEVAADFQVLRLHVQGRIHTASETHLLGDSESLNTAIQMARQYWLGIVESIETQETIFEGRVHVLEVVKEAEYA